MKSILKNASCLIRTRAFQIGFPERFSHRPDDLPDSVEEYLANLASEAMNDPASITSTSGEFHSIRRIIISQAGYLVLGIAGRLENFLSDPEKTCHQFCDNAGRKVYGFAGFVWDTQGAIQPLPQAFPSIQSFRNLMADLILTHWNDSNNSFWAETILKGGHSVAYDRVVEFNQDTPASGILPTLNLSDVGKIKLFPLKIGEALLHTAVLTAVKKATEKQSFSFCTDLHFSNGENTLFMNASISGDIPENGKSFSNRQLKEPKEIAAKRISESKSYPANIENTLEFTVNLGIYSNQAIERQICADYRSLVLSFARRLPVLPDGQTREIQFFRNSNIGVFKKAWNFFSGYVFFSYILTAKNLSPQEVTEILEKAKTCVIQMEESRENTAEILLIYAVFNENDANAKGSKKSKRNRILEPEPLPDADFSAFLQSMSQSSYPTSVDPGQLFGPSISHYKTRSKISPEISSKKTQMEKKKPPKDQDPFDF